MIYILDDDKSVCNAMRRLIQANGLEAETYHKAEDVLTQAAFAPGDALLADVTMSGMGGIELKRVLNGCGIEVPVIFITADDSESRREESRQVGAAGYFRKPIDDMALLDAIKFAIGKAVQQEVTGTRVIPPAH
ncbi:response regulator [Exilibacterium tricleocarpae]|uniref:Response regulator n=1 Tax=Exilibacterium tricleocarpae TaxID=2591008 RepID=A0A545U9U8_9GAMM|nr:response regulator [Exilibacterium tricleocarpae]TQV86248.1 response regulator [Exilibacterium tricleocarpae]